MGMLDFYKTDVGCRIKKVGRWMAPISFRTKMLSINAYKIIYLVLIPDHVQASLYH